MSEINDLESSLEDQLVKVREQKERLRNREAVLNPILQDPKRVDLSTEPLSGIFSAEVLRALGGSKVSSLTGAEVAESFRLGEKPLVRPSSSQYASELTCVDDDLYEDLDDEGVGGAFSGGGGNIHSLPIFHEAFCIKLLIEAQRIWDDLSSAAEFAGSAEETSMSHEAARLLERPLTLDGMGLSWLCDILLNIVVAPLAQVTHPTEARGTLDWRHAFFVGYGTSKSSPGLTRTSLARHTDDSEVTLNLCLKKSFEGGEVTFGAIRGIDDDPGAHNAILKPEVGRGIMHIGRHTHEVLPVASGERFALIMWARSLSGIRSEVCPCCWMNRRGKGEALDCICGPAWN